MGGGELGMSADAQVSQHDLTVHVQRHFPPKRKEDDDDVITMMP